MKKNFFDTILFVTFRRLTKYLIFMASDITTLRKSGKLNEAYQTAQKLFDENPADIWNRRNLAWVVYDFAKQKAALETSEQFFKCIDKLLELQMPEDEEVFHNSVAFLLRSMASAAVRAEKQDQKFFDNLFSRIKLLKIHKPSPANSALMQTFLRVKSWWKNYGAFCQYQGFDGFQDEDFLPQQTESGEKIMPLAERVIMSYCKFLLDNGSENDTAAFLPVLEDFSLKHKNYIYLPFYEAKLMWKIGKKDDYLKFLKIFARKKSGEFWVWDLFSDYYDDKILKLKLLSKALSLKSKPEMSIKVREKAAQLLYGLGYKKEALSELLFIEKIRQRNKWAVSQALSSTISQLQSEGIKPEKNNIDFFASFSKDADKIVFTPSTLEFEGKIIITPKGFGFVKFDGKTVFVPEGVLQNKTLKNNSVVKGSYKKSFNKKKNEDGYTAVEIF